MKKVLLMAAAVATLFASCSKDATEDVVTINGDAAFVASMTFDQDATTRHHINEDGVYEWEAGDMVGVTTAATDAEYVPFITKAGGVKAIFEAVGNDLDYIGDGPYYMAYPYGKTLTVSVDKETKATTISGLTVPATQRYRAGSFSTMTAPAYAIVDEFALEGQEVDFDPAAAMLQFYVKGVGSIESLNLHVDGVELSGDFNIVIEAEDAENEDAEVEAPAETVAVGSDVLLSFGQTPLKLTPYNAVPVVFVVKSGISLAGKTIELTADFGEQQIETVDINIPETATNMNDIPANALKTFVNAKSFGFEGKFVIDNKDAKLGLEGNDVAALDFLAYAYFAQENTQNEKFAADWEVVFKNLGADAYTLQAYILAEQIDLEAFNAETVYNKIGEYATREADEEIKAIVDVYQHVLTWYIKNENAIESLYWGDNGVAVVGGNTEPTVINGLTVLGNGITAGAGLENLKFNNTTVFATDGAEAVGFVAANDTDANVDVTLGEGNKLFATAAANGAYVGGIFGKYTVAKTAKVTVVALPTIEAGASTFSLKPEAVATAKVGQLYGYVSNIDAGNIKISLVDNKVTSLDVPAVHTVNGRDVIDFTSNIAAPEGAMYAGVIAEMTNIKPSIVVDGTSYWNGIGRSTANDGYSTAEELYKLLTQGQKANNFVMTNDIDMQNIELKLSALDANRGLSVVNKEMYELSNVNAVADANGYLALFGSNATIENLTVNNVAIASASKNLMFNVAGLAINGTAKNVVVNNLAINISATATVAGNTAVKNIGGVFAEADAEDIDNVEVKSFAINYAGEKALDVRAGVIAGTLNVAPNSTTNLGITKLSGTTKKYVFGNIGASQPATNNPKTALKWYTTEKNYAYSVTPYGTIAVTNADFASNGVINAYLNDNAQSKNFGRLAAGIVFSFENNGAPKAFGKDSSVEYKYNFFSNTKINNDADANGKFVWGFNPTAE